MTSTSGCRDSCGLARGDHSRSPPASAAHGNDGLVACTVLLIGQVGVARTVRKA